jgi:hypothetical protein
MQAAFRVLIEHCHSPYNCRNYGNHSQGAQLVLRILHSVNLPVSSGQLTLIAFFEDTLDFAEPQFGKVYRNVELSATANFQSTLWVSALM